MNKKKILITTSFLLSFIITLCIIFIPEKKEVKESLQIIQNTVNNEISTYDMTAEEVAELPTTEILEQSEEEENALEQEVEDEGFELQGKIAYNGASEYPTVPLGKYTGLTYYSQIDNRWRYLPYTSTNNASQTIGSSGCGSTSAAMIVTAIKGTITPPDMSALFVKCGFRSANNGTYWSAFRWVADVFNIDYSETIYLNEAVEKLNNNHYIIASCGNGLFTTGGHFIVLTGVENGMIKVYDPYLYAGKFDTATRRGKAIVNGNTVYVSIDNFRNYANYNRFFCFKYEGQKQENNTKPVVTSSYQRYVKVNTSLNVRYLPNGKIVGSLYNGNQVTVYETSGNWSRIGTNRWVSSTYLVSSNPKTTIPNTVGQRRKTKACYLYSNSNLTGTRYTYRANTTLTILKNMSVNVDYVRVNATGRKAYINKNNYR